ncbi:uncharacterized protein [Haliotis cracherodii]|uniref:uncharacterized protein n=1 Tax=Haliotis cracherodii TaxID=6455 RepID=UPI0039EAEC6A
MSLSMYTLDLCILLGTTLMVDGEKIQNVGTNLVWSHDYELDMRGHCSFTFSVAYCGAFKLELYPDKDLPEPKYEIYIDRYSLEKYKVGIRKSCDAAHLLCSNDGMGTSGHENTPLVICDGSTWTPFWISWFGGVIILGKGTTVGEAILKEVSDPQFKHIDYVKMGADNKTTEANYRFEPRDGRTIDPDMSCRNIATTSVAPVATATTHGTTTAATTTTPAATTQTGGPTTAETTTPQVKIQNVGTNLVWSHDYELDMRGHCSFTFSVAYCGAFKLELYPDKDLPEPKYEIYIDRYSLEKYKVGIRKSCDAAHLLCSNDGMGTSGHENTPLVICDGSTWTPFWISWFGGVIILGKGTTVGEAILKEVSDPQFKHIDYVKMGADNKTTEANYRFEPRDGRTIDPDMSCRNIATTSVAPVATATTHGTTTAATTQTGAATTQTGGPTTAETTTPQVKIQNVGTNLVWSHDYELDMRGHCSFTFSVAYCGAFKLELYPDKDLPEPKYEIYIDRYSLEKYKVGIRKSCDAAHLLCSNDGMGTSGHENTPLVICDGSTWTPFWISWFGGVIILGKGTTVGEAILKEVSDPQFKHIDYVKMGADNKTTEANYRFEPRDGRTIDPDMSCRNIATTSVAPVATATTHGTTTAATTQTGGPTTAETTTPQEKIQNVGTNLVWSHDYELDMRGHCSFTFSVAYCGAFKLELYPDKDLPEPKYEIYIDRYSLEKYKVGIRKSCDAAHLLCSNDGMSTSGHENTPLVICDGSTWTPFWISWFGGVIILGKGTTVGEAILKEVSDPQFKHIDYVKMGADNKTTEANYRFEPRDGRTIDPDMSCRNIDAAKITAPTARTQTDGSAATSATATSAATTQTGGPEATSATAQTFVKMRVNNCDNERRPYSEDLAMVFEVAADDTTLSPSNPDVVELSSATSGSCAEMCASRKTCVMYSISNTGTCRITSACQPVVEGETNSAILFLKYWG